MQTVFSAKEPLLKVSDDPDEQLGMMWLFSGAMMALRNPRGHRVETDDQTTREECLEWLGKISALLRVVDRAELVTPEETED
jgi:hypothetical protein